MKGKKSRAVAEEADACPESQTLLPHPPLVFMVKHEDMNLLVIMPSTLRTLHVHNLPRLG